MLSKLFGPNRESVPKVNEELMWQIITDLRVQFPVPLVRWEIIDRYGRRYSETSVHNAITRAIELGEIFDDEGDLYFRVAHY